MAEIKSKVYFLGSGRIAVPVLKVLAASNRLELVGIGTQQDRPAGRHKTLCPTPVGEWALSNSVAIDKPQTVNSPDFLNRLNALAPDVILVISFGQLLKEGILGLPSVACVNVHASILPKYRGASPIAAAILHGDSETGVAFMKMEKGLDTGAVYHTCRMKLDGTEFSDSLEEKLGELAAQNAEDVLLKIIAGQVIPEEQDHDQATYAGKIKKTDGWVSLEEQADVIERKVRAYHPWPGAYFMMDVNGVSRKVQITDARVVPEAHGKAGEFLRPDSSSLVLVCGNNTGLCLKKIIPEGRKEMSGADFARGLR